MERLTERTSEGIWAKEDYGENVLKTLYCCYGAEPNPHYNNCEEGYCAIEKLAEYEDLEEQGKLLRLPCAVGDTVYLILYEYTLCTPYGERFEESSCCGCGAWECDSKREYYIKEQSVFNLEWIVRNMEQSNFGKTVFLSQEEAAAALQTLKETEGEK